MKFAILSQYYPPEIGAPQARLSELAVRVAAAGHDVSVLTAMPNYPTGRIYPGYGGLLKRERIAGVPVMRSVIYPTQSPARLPRLLNYFSFAASSLLAGPLLPSGLDALMVESPPLFLGPTGYLLSRLKRAKLIFNVSDLWPESAVRLGLLDSSSSAYRVAAAIESFCYQHAWVVSGQSKSIIADVQRRFPGVATYHLSNGADTRRFTPDLASVDVRRRLMGGRDGVLAVYAGLHGLAQGLDQIVGAASTMAADADLRFALVGDGPEKTTLQAHARQAGLESLSFFDAVPFADVPVLLASADIIIVALKTEILGAVPSKLYEAMATGRPVVLVASGEAADIVRDHGAGIAVPPGDRDGLVSALRRLREDPALRAEMGARGRAAAVAHFDRDRICARFVEFLQNELPMKRGRQ